MESFSCLPTRLTNTIRQRIHFADLRKTNWEICLWKQRNCGNVVLFLFTSHLKCSLMISLIFNSMPITLNIFRWLSLFAAKHRRQELLLSNIALPAYQGTNHNRFFFFLRLKQQKKYINIHWRRFHKNIRIWAMGWIILLVFDNSKCHPFSW